MNRKSKTVELDGRTYVLTSTGRVRLEGENFNGCDVVPDDGGDVFTVPNFHEVHTRSL